MKVPVKPGVYCGLSMSVFGISPPELVPGTSTTSSGRSSRLLETIGDCDCEFLVGRKPDAYAYDSHPKAPIPVLAIAQPAACSFSMPPMMCTPI